jgi:hypothetical protein
MLLGVPAVDVCAAFPGDGMSPRELHAALDRCNFLWNAFVFGTLVCEGFYLLAVPSLNFEAGGHTILLEWRGCFDLSTVYDPNRGREGKKFYTASKEDAGGVPIRWWTDMIYVVPGGCLPPADKERA